MSGFDPTWLALREGYDHAARDPALTAAFVEALGPSPRLIELGCGSGSNLRYLFPQLPAAQSWTCIDRDATLLELLETAAPPEITVETRCLDLASNLDDLPIEPGVGVTASALLDLTSASWIEAFAACCRHVPVLIVLSFDGRLDWQPADPASGPIRDAFLRHQERDKGFGPSLGPAAAAYLAERFRDLGHEVRLARSDWVLDATDDTMLEAMLAGVASAAGEVDPALPLQTWLKRRRADLAAGRLALRVGHLDLLALPR